MNITNPYRHKKFTPASIDGLDLWLDASDSATLFDAITGGSTPADNASIARWEDKSGNANHAVQSTVSQQPLRRAAQINGLDALDFDGSNDFMSGTAELTPRQTEAKTVFMVTYHKTSSTGAALVLYSSATVGAHGAINAEVSYRCVGRTWVSTDPLANGQATILTLAQSGSGNLSSTISMWEDGASIARDAGSSADGLTVDATAGWEVGGTSRFSSYIDAYFCEVVIYDTELSAGDRGDVETYLANKWGIASTSIKKLGPKFTTFGRAAREFDGTTNSIIIGDVLDDSVFTSESWSFSFWVKRNSENDIQYCISKIGDSLNSPAENQRQFGGSLRSAADDYRFTFAWYGSLTSSTYRVMRTTSQIRASDGWVHLVVSYNKYASNPNNRLKIYRNGVEDVELWMSAGTPNTIPDGTARLALGGSVGSDGSNNTTSPLRPLDGSMADVRLYDRELTAADAISLSQGINVDKNLIGHWLTNENDVKDYSVSPLNNHIPEFSDDGPLPGNASFGNKSRLFNPASGTCKYLTIPDYSELPTGAQTWACWVKFDATSFNGNGQDIFGQWDYTSNNKGVVLYMPAGGSTAKPRFYIGDNANNAFFVETAAGLSPNVWYHLAGVFKPGELRIYVNGSLSATNTSGIPSSIKNPSGVDVRVGLRDSINDLPFSGKIADCRIYDADIGTTAIAGLAAGTDYTTNLIGHWIKNSNDLLDHSGLDYHAYLENTEVIKHHGDNIESPEFSTDGPLPDNKIFGKNSLKFNGVSDYVDLGNSLDDVFAGTGKKFTITAWVKTNSFNDTHIVAKYATASNQREFLIRVLSDGNLAMVMSGDGNFGSNRWGRQTDTSPISANTWHHVAITYDQTATGDYLRMFVDGTEDATLTDWLSNGTFTSIYNSTTTLRISGTSENTGPWVGNIADVRIYDTALDNEDISSIADGIHIQDNLVGWWGLNEKSLKDFSYNSSSKFITDSPFIDTSNFASRLFNPTGAGAAGNEEHVAIPSNSDIPRGEQTWAFWVKPLVTSSGGQSFIGQWGNSGDFSFIVYYVGASLAVYISANGSTNVNSGSYSFSPNSTNVWRHVAFTFVPNTSLKLYVDGELRSSNTTNIPAAIYNSPADLRFGRMDRSHNAAFSGNISDVRMYDADIGEGVIASLSTGEDYRTNLKGQWLTRFNNLLDYAGNNDAINSSSIYSNDNPFATELDFASRIFDGINDHVNLGDALGDVFHGTGAKWTISTWVKANDLDDDLILSRWNYGLAKREFFFRVTTTGELAVSLSSDGTLSNRWGRKTGTGVITQSSWHHISVTYDQSATGNYLSIWVDGNEQTLNAYNVDGSFSSIYNGGSDFYISGLPTDSASMWEGNVADLRVYDTVISDVAILNLSQGIGVDQNLVGRWLTNNDDVDDYVGTNHGTNYGSIYSKGANPFNQIGITSRTLDGVDDYITIPDPNESTTNLSVALWVKTTDVDWVTTHLAHWRSIDDNRAWWIGPSRTAESNGKKLMVYLSEGQGGGDDSKRYYGTTDVSDGAWHHVAFTWDNGTLKLFVDGSEETTTKPNNSVFTSIKDSDGPITVGCTWVNDAPANYGSGGRADIRIYNSTLSVTDITDLYNGVDVQTGLAGHWLTNNNDDVDDYVGTNNGTNFGSTFNFENYNIGPTKFGVASRIFDGVDDQISIPDINENVNNLSVLFWVKTTEIHYDKILFAHWDIDNDQRSWAVTLSQNTILGGTGLSATITPNGISAGKRYATNTPAGVISDGTWHHCAMTWGSGTLKLYVDGVEASVTKQFDGLAGSLFNSSGKITINGGRNLDEATSLTDAAMADCRIYNTTLSEGEVLSIKNGEDNILNKNSLVGHWLTNADSFNDFSGNGNHALPAKSDGSFGGSKYSTDGPT